MPFALSLALSLTSQQRAGAAAAATTLDVPASGQVIYSVKKVTGYAGSFGIAQKVSTVTQQTIGWGADNYYDTAALDTFAAGADIEWVTIYDQSGSGKDWVGSSGPLYNPTARNVFGAPSFGFSPKASTSNYNMALPGTLTGSRQAITVVTVDAMQASLSNTGAKWGLGSSSTDRLDYCARADNDVQILNTASFVSTGLYNGCLPEVNVTACGASNTVAHVNGTSATVAANTATSWTGGFVAHSAFGWNYVGDYFFFGIWPSQLAAGVVTTLKTNLYSAFNVPTARTMNVCMDGDSIEFGQFSTYGINTARQLDGLLTRKAFMSNMGVPGRTAATCASNFAANVTNRKRAGLVNIYIGEAGTNDIAASTAGLTLWTGSVLPMIQAALAAGFDKVYYQTIPPRNGLSGPQETERLAFNAQLRDATSQSTNNYTCVDICALTAFDAVPTAASDYGNTSIYWTDGIHGITTGMYAQFAAARAALVNAAYP